MNTRERTTGSASAADVAKRRAAQTLLVDSVTAEVLAAFAHNDIDCILLRGPGVARRLYDATELRSYIDADLLVSPRQISKAADTLASIGFKPLANEGDLDLHRPIHAHEWQRGIVSVDLHQRVAGCTMPDDVTWKIFSEHSESITIAGSSAKIPSRSALALIVALHAAHNGPRMPKPLADLERALDRFDDETWHEAAQLAENVGALPAFAAGLRLLPAGAARAPEVDPTVDVALRSSGAPPLSLGLDWLMRTNSLSEKAALVKHVVLPPPGALRTWRPLARRGRAGLIAAYVSQPLWLLRHAIPSLRAVIRARQQHS
ncbi:MAG TPA: nucleotidyltransferase family protein [Tepidisphaeraceae bacterium]|nr:nucleotidyltransferase family protein [Tepidisphaeraceae bacterium]